MTSFLKSAFKHGIRPEQIDDVLRSEYTEAFDEGFEKGGSYCVMYVGFDSQGALLEVKVKFVENRTSGGDSTKVFHANKATRKYQLLFNQRKGR